MTKQEKTALNMAKFIRGKINFCLEQDHNRLNRKVDSP